MSKTDRPSNAKLAAKVAIVTVRRKNPFIAQALIHLKEDGYVPFSVQRYLLAWEEGRLPSQATSLSSR